MPKKRCKTPCESRKICNPSTGRCVLRKGKIGKQLSKSRRSKSLTKKRKTSRKTKRSKSSKIKQPTSPFIALGKDVVRYGIKPFVEAKGRSCSALTQKFGCKGTSSVFMDNKGNRVDCAWYCMSSCQPSDLINIITSPKTITFERSDGRKDKETVNIDGFESIFSVDMGGWDEQVIISDSNEPDGVRIEEPSIRPITVSKINAAKILCNWFKKWTNRNERIEIFTEIEIKSADDPPVGSRIIKFDRPWIRPIREWSIEIGATIPARGSLPAQPSRPRIVLEMQIENPSLHPRRIM